MAGEREKEQGPRARKREPDTIEAASPGDSGEREASWTPDMERARRIAEDVGTLPVPRSVRQARGERLEAEAGSPYDLERGLLPGGRRPPPRRAPRQGPAPPREEREEEARLRRTQPHASRTPEELGSALRRQGDEGLPDPQRGHEAGPPLPGEDGEW